MWDCQRILVGKSIGSRKTHQLNFWTPEEYHKFIEQLSSCKDSYDNLTFFTIFEILYYTGMRVGELLALTLQDIDFKENKISINKGYYRDHGERPYRQTQNHSRRKSCGHSGLSHPGDPGICFPSL
ncbi:MAG: tyrosine-type recombinase/integrase [Blautia caecimuris]